MSQTPPSGSLDRLLEISLRILEPRTHLPRGPCGAEGLSRISILDFVTSRFPCLSATLGPRGGVTDSDYALVELKFHSSYVSHDGV